TLLALSMFGLFTLQLPSSLQTRLTLMSNRQQGGSPGGVFVMGVIAGLNASLLLEALDRREQGMLTACVDELVEAGRSSCLDVVA
ncbi:hypothetical protein, partial [Salmonella enterica]|uniref:cytochrome c biogenesis protein CcdA n=1 Tax=Salmonella enterica TaxID=28901 RepID=UPI001FAFCE71